ncbi:hypothetical protein ASPTUDRAFT_47290 [Aspergillus tubingensis CBS 134.48]|uniref:Uncharacterized protein n=1 Tax=Aspergillus tubingensis (strain CBS 134.48) TaxID=767770 RepID=A0A1L9MT84_ASPTC|nr:hypothetical protein ASPTUDRAFT_47290 [Aspergillus tubingensis CBS 134.48]
MLRSSARVHAAAALLWSGLYPTHIPVAKLASFDWGSTTGNSLQPGSQTSKHLHHLNSSRSCLSPHTPYARVTCRFIIISLFQPSALLINEGLATSTTHGPQYPGSLASLPPYLGHVSNGTVQPVRKGYQQ